MTENTEGAADQNEILRERTTITLKDNAANIENGEFDKVVLPKRKETGFGPAIKAAEKSAAKLGIKPETTKI